jgi:dienelactone hydrolase
MDIVSETVKYGVVERRFDLKVADETVPGVVWVPEGASGPRPKVLFGHGGSQHKKVAHIPSFAKRLAAHGWASVAIDAPGHGDRVSEEEKQLSPTERAVLARQRLRDLTGEELKQRSAMAVAEWRATLDAVEALDDVGVGPTGYWGVSMGTIFGVPLLAEEPRITCAVLGLMGLGVGGGRKFETNANAIEIPLQFILQWGDELVSPDRGIALYEAFGSNEKMLIANPGPHAAVPPFVFPVNEEFFQRHLSVLLSL